MEMDEEFLEVNDIDWFAVGADGYVCHFATGGRGIVPRQVASSIESWQLACDYIYSLPVCSGVIVVEESLPDFSGLAQREAYLGSFLEMASRGIFSHDVSGGLSPYRQAGACASRRRPPRAHSKSYSKDRHRFRR